MKPVNPRGPRLLDPFARDVFIGSLRSPLHPADDAAEDAALGDPLDAPTLIRRPARPAPRPAATPAQPSREPTKPPRGETELTQTLVRALPAPVLRRSEEKPSSPEPAKTPAPTSRLRPLIAALMLVAVALSGARLLWQRRAVTQAATPTTAVASSAPNSSERSPQAPPDPAAASAQRRAAQGAALPVVPPAEPGKTRQRQAVDLVARGAFAEAAAVYELLSRQTDDPTFREAARVAHRKAARSKQ